MKRVHADLLFTTTTKMCGKLQTTSINLLEMFTGDFSFGSEILVDVNNHRSDEAEQETESEDNGVSNPGWKGRLSLGEEGFLSFVLQEGWELVIPVVDVDKVRHGEW